MIEKVIPATSLQIRVIRVHQRLDYSDSFKPRIYRDARGLVSGFFPVTISTWPGKTIPPVLK